MREAANRLYEYRAALVKAHQFPVLFLAFEGRDRGSPRWERTLDSLGPLAAKTDEDVREVLGV
jgi:hypothetical protein